MAVWKFDLCGNRLAIDFANTVSSRHTSEPIDRLPTYADSVEFARQTSTISDEEAKRLQEEALQRPAEAAGTLHDAVTLREALYRMFAAVAAGESPRHSDLMILNAQLTRFRLNDRFEWEWASQYGGLDHFTGAFVRDAVNLFTDGPRERIHMCKAEDCLWIFFDTSKNHSRKWCDMAQCGNRAKVRRFHSRKKAQSRP